MARPKTGAADHLSVTVRGSQRATGAPNPKKRSNPNTASLTRSPPGHQKAREPAIAGIFHIPQPSWVNLYPTQPHGVKPRQPPQAPQSHCHLARRPKGCRASGRSRARRLGIDRLSTPLYLPRAISRKIQTKCGNDQRVFGAAILRYRSADGG